jgi:hypothetical protein
MYKIKISCVLITVDRKRGAQWPALRRVIAEVKQRWSVIEWVTKIYYLELLRASVGTLSRWSRLHLQSLGNTNPHWARVMGNGPF